MRLLALLLRSRVTANGVSLAGTVVALLGAGTMLLAPRRPGLWLLAALAIQGRLVANLMDGLVAVEGGRGAPTGAIWNEAPDRLQDSVLLVAFGYAVGLPWLGWLAALLAAVAAYTRLLGGTLGLAQDFSGPMAKQHRMAALTIGSLAAPLEVWTIGSLWAPRFALAIVAAGTVVTIGRRLRRQAQALEARAGRDPRARGDAP